MVKEESKIIDVGEDLLEILTSIKEGYNKALGLKIGWKQASYILAKKIKKADLIFQFP